MMTRKGQKDSSVRRRKSMRADKTLANSKPSLTDQDLYLFNEGTHYRLYEKMGCHPSSDGFHFAVWAPDAVRVSVVGDFNGWDKEKNPLLPQANSGIWEASVENATPGDLYKYCITSRFDQYEVEKCDPFGFFAEESPRTASVVCQLDYEWSDRTWMSEREKANNLKAPISIYEMHLGSWMRGDGKPLTYRELAPRLSEYVVRLGFTHVEFLPVMEHPFGGSWGYQTTGYFAPTSRYGSPQDFMHLIDHLHQNGVGVILDWVPSHFPTDEHGLGFFDGTHLYEHADPKKGFHPDWNSYIFNYGRNEVRSFLISSALFWLDRYHVDGIRVDAVASMLYLDYSRKEGEWIPNKYGGRENIEAIDFLRQLNSEIYSAYPGVQTYAEESTDWPMVSRPTYIGGLGFGMKWDMGWMHDTLEYMTKNPVHRRFHHNNLTFRMLYAFHENFVLPLSHDEVVHGKGSLLGKMPGDDWQKFANLRVLFGYMFAQPAKKLLFMGGEIGQWNEWNHDSSVDWHLMEYAPHQGLQRWVADLNHLYKREAPLYERDFEPAGFEWVDCSDSEQSVVALIRSAESTRDLVLVACNFTPVPRNNYRLGVPRKGFWTEILNSDARDYGGSGQGNLGKVEARPVPFHGKPYSLNITLPPLSVLFFKSEARIQ